MILQRNTAIGSCMKRYILLIVVAMIGSSISGCTFAEMKSEKIQDIEYQMISDWDMPEEVLLLIEENQGTKIKMSYTDQGKEYIIIGYGEQETSGYSVEVLEVYETETTICVDTNLIGPTPDEEIANVITYPYIVICIEENQKPIVYE